MYAIYTMRKLMLTNRVNTLNMKLMQISQKTQDLAAYAANIADGIITPEEAANSPASIFNRQSAYMRVTTPNALTQANMATQQYMMQYNALNAGSNGAVANTIDPSGATSTPNPTMLMSSFYKQAMDAAAQNEQKRIDALEKELDQQRLSIQTQLTAAQTELDEVTKSEEGAIKASTPHYNGGNA